MSNNQSTIINNQSQMTFSQLRLNPSVPKAQRLRLSKQAKAVYNRLVAGPIWTNELITIAKQYNARINEIRKCLMEFGLTVDMVESRPDGNNRYKIVPLHGSKYQAKLMARSQISKQMTTYEILNATYEPRAKSPNSTVRSAGSLSR